MGSLYSKVSKLYSPIEYKTKKQIADDNSKQPKQFRYSEQNLIDFFDHIKREGSFRKKIRKLKKFNKYLKKKGYNYDVVKESQFEFDKLKKLEELSFQVNVGKEAWRIGL